MKGQGKSAHVPIDGASFSWRGRIPQPTGGSPLGKLSMIQVSFLKESPILRDATKFGTRDLPARFPSAKLVDSSSQLVR